MKLNLEKVSECAQTRQMLLDHFDLKTLPELSEGIQAHLQRCQRCQSELQSLEILQRNLEMIPHPEPSENYWINYLPQLHRHMEAPDPVRQGGFAWIPSLGFTVMVLLFLITASPRLAPPTWFTSAPTSSSVQEYVTILGDQTTLSSEVSTDSFTAGLDQAELAFLEKLSDFSQVTVSDPLEILAQMDDNTIETVFARLKSLNIIKS